MKTYLSLLALLFSSFLFNTSLNAQTIQFVLEGLGGSGLLSTNETGPVNGTPGSGGEVGGGVFYDDSINLLTVNVGWGSGNGFLDLTGNATGAHIHGPAAQNATAGVIFNLSSALDPSATSGGVSNYTTTLTAGQESDLLAGLYYINVHTSTNGGGEIRGNLVAVPEPSAAALMLAVLLGFCFLRRRVS